jgi:3-hydroxyacyl-[acyl-carrier-protein] dehydratase
MMDIYQILKQLPHRFPILLVDRVLEIEKGVRIKALKNVSVNEPYFTGHFPSRPVMPGVLMLEALAQAAALLAFDTMGETPHEGGHFQIQGTRQSRRRDCSRSRVDVHHAQGCLMTEGYDHRDSHSSYRPH